MYILSIWVTMFTAYSNAISETLEWKKIATEGVPFGELYKMPANFKISHASRGQGIVYGKA
jgi:hypothetical protein